MASLFFLSEGIDFKLLHPRKTSSWIKSTIKKEKRSLSTLTFIFCSDRYLHSLNVTYLHHKTLTDIITFDYSTDANRIEGEIYISVERVMENAPKFKNSFNKELHRVIIHGVLHLLGYNDKRSSEKAQIRKKEEAYLSLLN